MKRFRTLPILMVLGLCCLLAVPPRLPAQSQNQQLETIPTGKFRIAGMVVDALSGAPLDRTRVTIADVNNRQRVQSVVTADDGRFEFHVGPGKYALQGDKRGFVAASYNQHERFFSSAIVTGAELDTEHLVLRLPPAAVLGGKVYDEAGDPVRDASVRLYREDHRLGMSRVLPEGISVTDDQGAYEFAPLDEGTYYVSVSAAPWYAMHPATSNGQNPPTHVDSSLDVVYPATYYDNTTNSDDARPIPVRGGDHLNLDFHLSPVAALHILFRATADSDGNFTMPVLQQSSFGSTSMDPQADVQNIDIERDGPGLFEMTGVPPGHYTLRLPASTSGEPGAASQIDLTENGQEVDPTAGRPVSSVKATVALQDGSALPPRLFVALQSAGGRTVAVAAVDEKGDVDFSQVDAGSYAILAGTSTEAYAVARVTAAGKPVAGHTLNVPPGTELTVSLSVAPPVTAVEGFARSKDKATPGAMVVLVPKNPVANRDLFRRDQSDLDGSFHLRDVVPGTYTVTAIENGWDLDWSKPQVIAHYAQHGQTVVVSPDSKPAIHLPHPVEVQAK
jgi:5-hydroxyisourate hydrolase-like protein (transthyretin family)